MEQPNTEPEDSEKQVESAVGTAIDQHAKSAAIKASLANELTVRLRAADPPSSWKFLDSRLSLFHALAECGNLLEELRADYTDDELVAAGIAQRDSSNHVVLTTTLTALDQSVLLVRDLHSNAAIDVLTEWGPLGGGPAVFSRDGELIQVAEEEGPLFFAAFSLADVAVLRTCGIPATLANGLDTLSPSDVQRLCKTFRIEMEQSFRSFEAEDEGPDSPIDEPDPLDAMNDASSDGEVSASDPSDESHPASPVGPPSRMLVLVGWQPASVSEQIPEQLPKVADYFQILKEHMGIVPGHVRVWRPPEGDMRRFEFYVQHGDLPRLREAMLDSIYDCLEDLSPYSPRWERAAAEDKSLPAVLSRIYQLARQQQPSTYVRDMRREWARVEQALDEQLFQPLMEEALLALDPQERNLRLAAATIGRQAHVQALAFSVQTTLAIRSRGIHSLDPFPHDGLKDVLKLGKQVIELYREIKKCQNTSRIVSVEMLPGEKPPLALPASG